MSSDPGHPKMGRIWWPESQSTVPFNALLKLPMCVLLKHTNYLLLEIPDFDVLAPYALSDMLLVETTFLH